MKRFSLAAVILLAAGAPAGAEVPGALPLLRSMTPGASVAIPEARAVPVAVRQRQGWPAVLDSLRRYGEFQPGDGPMIPPSLGLRDVRGPLDGSHSADYANMWGGPDEDGSFVGAWVSMVSEDWRLQPGGRVWRIEQWVLTLTME
ncbi:MAG: hypothetical protein PHF00_07670, partial [Elusimicrobia bacterium]|nr:hypothetical protein [Elusimicrobiota bacterium]